MSKRWKDAAGELRKRFDAAKSSLDEIVSELQDLQSEMQTEYDDMSERRQESENGQRFETCANIDLDLIDSCLCEIDDVITQVEEADLPKGFE